MRLVVLAFLPGITLSLMAPALSAESPGNDPPKAGYTLLNPVPDDRLRELSTDRPGKSHSAITVDAGRFQVESDFMTYTYDPRGRGYTTTNAYSIGPRS